MHPAPHFSTQAAEHLLHRRWADLLVTGHFKVRVNVFFIGCSTGFPQGCVLCSLLLCVLYTNNCQSHHKGHHIIKFADDSVIVSLLSSETSEHGPIVHDFMDWCESSFSNIDVNKTKGVCIEFGEKPTAIFQRSLFKISKWNSNEEKK